MRTQAKLKLVVGLAVQAMAQLPHRRAIPAYRPGEAQRCPYCDGQNWHVGRASATCGFCDSTLPLASNGSAA